MEESPVWVGRPWERFAVGKPSSNPRWTETTCQPLETVSHVAHVDTALDIVQDGRIRPGLVFDKSKLNKDRILVAWTSPNDWSGAGGFRSGNISFDFNWETLIKGLNYYWVEDVAYGIPACRILVTDQYHGDKPDKLERYDPTLGAGPWWHDTSSDKHYWNGNYCLEIMLERELLLSEAIGIDFVGHSRKGCCNDYKTCPEMGDPAEKGGAKFLAGLAGRYLDGKQVKLTGEVEGIAVPSSKLEAASRKLQRELVPLDEEYTWGGPVRAEDVGAAACVRALLNAYSRSQAADQRALAGLFASERDLRRICLQLIGNMFGTLLTGQTAVEGGASL